MGDLVPGMYVCELDRPWLETPFLFQGFLIERVEQIEEIARYCRYVHVDLLRSDRELMARAAPARWATPASPAAAVAGLPAGCRPYADETTLEEEDGPARAA